MRRLLNAVKEFVDRPSSPSKDKVLAVGFVIFCISTALLFTLLVAWVGTLS